jgi:hypothetical protein
VTEGAVLVPHRRRRDDRRPGPVSSARPVSRRLLRRRRHRPAGDPGGQADDGVGYAPSFYPGTISWAQAERVTLRVGQDAQPISFAVTPIRFSTVSGTVVNSSGQPVQALNVWLNGAGPTDRAGGRGRPDGTFVVTNVAPGDYVLRVSTGVLGQQEMASLPVTVSGNEVRGLTAVLAPGGTARGRVIFEGNPASPPRVVLLHSRQHPPMQGPR